MVNERTRRDDFPIAFECPMAVRFRPAPVRINLFDFGSTIEPRNFRREPVSNPSATHSQILAIYASELYDLRAEDDPKPNPST